MKQAQRLWRWASLCVFLPIITGCSVVDRLTPRGYAEQIASLSGWQAIKFETKTFVLHGFYGDFSSAEKTLVVYIGGDGHAWRNRWTPSTDPTPWNPIALRLAVQTPEPKVLFLGRPCQFTTHATRRGCEVKYWTSHRYSLEVVNALSEAIDQAKILSETEQILIVGYSGGGVLAALLSAQRNDVRYLATIAANLDLDVWVKEQEIKPLLGSLNPVDFSEKLSDIPQTHLIGVKDTVVPATVMQSYLLKLYKPPIAHLVEISDYGHQCCWVENWQKLYTENLVIQGPRQGSVFNSMK